MHELLVEVNEVITEARRGQGIHGVITEELQGL
jgi:hypothetical protein